MFQDFSSDWRPGGAQRQVLDVLLPSQSYVVNLLGLGLGLRLELRFASRTISITHLRLSRLHYVQLQPRDVPISSGQWPPVKVRVRRRVRAGL